MGTHTHTHTYIHVPVNYQTLRLEAWHLSNSFLILVQIKFSKRLKKVILNLLKLFSPHLKKGQCLYIRSQLNLEPLPVNLEHPTTGLKIRSFIYCVRRRTILRNKLKRVQAVHIVLKSWEVRNNGGSTKMADENWVFSTSHYRKETWFDFIFTHFQTYKALILAFTTWHFERKGSSRLRRRLYWVKYNDTEMAYRKEQHSFCCIQLPNTEIRSVVVILFCLQKYHLGPNQRLAFQVICRYYLSLWHV